METRNENPAPFMAVHPGIMVKPELQERGISQKDFAKMLDVQASHLSEVLNGKRSLSAELAVKIQNAIGIPAEILLSAQAQYELESVVTKSNNNQIQVIKKPNSKLLFFCETCFLNIYDDNIEIKEHNGHKIIKIDENKEIIITEEEFNNITNNIKEEKDKINDYLPKMKDMLLDNSKSEKDKIEVMNLYNNSIYINRTLFDFLWLVYKIYEVNKKQNEIKLN